MHDIYLQSTVTDCSTENSHKVIVAGDGINRNTTATPLINYGLVIFNCAGEVL